MAERSGGSGRFGPVDAGDLIGTASARLLAVGIDRRARLTALRVLGLLADHAGADLVVRRPPRDLAAEFDIGADDLGEALVALTAVQVVTVDTEGGLLAIAAPAPSRGGLRLESFLANAGRGDEPVVLAPLPDLVAPRPAAPARPSFGLLLGDIDLRSGRSDLTSASDLHADAGIDVPASQLGGRRQTEVREGVEDETGVPGHDSGGKADVIPLVVGPLPHGARRRPARVATAALVAAAAVLVLALNPDLEQASTTSVVGDVSASTGEPDEEASAVDAPATARRRTGVGPDLTSSSTHVTIRGVEGRSSSSPDAVGDDGHPSSSSATSPASVAAPLDSLAPTDGPTATDGPVGGVSDPVAAPPRDGPGAAPPTAGPVVPPCADLAPVMEVVRTLTDASERPVDGHRDAQVVTIQGTATNGLDEAVVVERFSVDVNLADGSSRGATSLAPVLLGPSATTTWTVEVAVEGVAPTGIDVVVLEWSQADGDPTTACPP